MSRYRLVGAPYGTDRANRTAVEEAIGANLERVTTGLEFDADFTEEQTRALVDGGAIVPVDEQQEESDDRSEPAPGQPEPDPTPEPEPVTGPEQPRDNPPGQPAEQPRDNPPGQPSEQPRDQPGGPASTRGKSGRSRPR